MTIPKIPENIQIIPMKEANKMNDAIDKIKLMALIKLLEKKKVITIEEFDKEFTVVVKEVKDFYKENKQTIDDMTKPVKATGGDYFG